MSYVQEVLTQLQARNPGEPEFQQAGFEVISAPMGYLSAGYERPLGGWLPESRVIWQSSLLLNEAIGLLAYPIVYGKQ